ncbi:MAG: serine hydrolase [Ignavibacteriae bacterium]|nr:serine hydrolase [Ignavibacteriota bacterium]
MRLFLSVIVLGGSLLLLSCGAALESSKPLAYGAPESVGFNAARLARLDSIMHNALADSTFPAAQLCVIKDNFIVYNKAFGRYTYDVNAPQTNLQTMFDMASLTKVVATTSAVMKLCDEKKLSLDDKVSKFVPAFAKGTKSNITIRHLMLHNSGLPPFRQLWKFVPEAKDAIDSVYATSLVANPGDTTIYSDLGFITLGKIIENVSGMRLNEYVSRNFFQPLGMTRTMFLPFDFKDQCAPTEFDSLWRKHLVQGIVHDENADFLGGVSGHAGLFSTASDVAIFMQMLLNGGDYDGRSYLESSTVTMFTKRQSERSTRALGWDTKSAKGASAGNLFSPNSFGHTGFTGTSIWVDPERNLAVILVTNRVHPMRANTKIFKIRPAVADAVIEALR